MVPHLQAVGTILSPPMATPPSNVAWHASMGCNDLSQRQLFLLKEMLNPATSVPDEAFAEDIPEEVVAVAFAAIVSGDGATH
jgi:hypothetical protein